MTVRVERLLLFRVAVGKTLKDVSSMQRQDEMEGTALSYNILHDSNLEAAVVGMPTFRSPVVAGTRKGSHLARCLSLIYSHKRGSGFISSKTLQEREAGTKLEHWY